VCWGISSTSSGNACDLTCLLQWSSKLHSQWLEKMSGVLQCMQHSTACRCRVDQRRACVKLQQSNVCMRCAANMSFVSGCAGLKPQLTLSAHNTVEHSEGTLLLIFLSIEVCVIGCWYAYLFCLSQRASVSDHLGSVVTVHQTSHCVAGCCAFKRHLAVGNAFCMGACVCHTPTVGVWGVSCALKGEWAILRIRAAGLRLWSGPVSLGHTGYSIPAWAALVWFRVQAYHYNIRIQRLRIRTGGHERYA
jgi:hypothetical protein